MPISKQKFIINFRIKVDTVKTNKWLMFKYDDNIITS